MDSFRYYDWLARQAWEGVFVHPILCTITIVLSLGVGIAFFMGDSWTAQATRRSLLAVAALTPAPFLILGVGTIYRARPGFPGRRAPGEPLLLLLILAQVGVGVFLIFRLKGQRRFAAALFVWAMWFTIWAMFVAAMAVNDDWI